MDENSNDSDEFNNIGNETSEEDEESQAKNKNGSNYRSESEQLKVSLFKKRVDKPRPLFCELFEKSLEKKII